LNVQFWNFTLNSGIKHLILESDAKSGHCALNSGIEGSYPELNGQFWNRAINSGIERSFLESEAEFLELGTEGPESPRF